MFPVDQYDRLLSAQAEAPGRVRHGFPYVRSGNIGSRRNTPPGPGFRIAMPFLADLTAALVAGLLALLAAHWYGRSGAVPERPTEEVARAVGQAVKPHTRFRRVLARRLDREVASGLLLTLALAVTLVGGLVLGLLALLVRRVAVIQRVDNSVAAWGYDHRSDTSTRGLHAITDLGNIQIVVVLALVLTLVDLLWRGNRRTFLFLLVVLGGMELAQLGVKDLVGRVRPTLDPAAASARALVPERAFGDGGCLLRRNRTDHRACAPSPGSPCRHRRGRGDRCRRGGEPRPARPALAVGRRRRACARLGMVRALRRRLRRTAARAYRGGRRRSERSRSHCKSGARVAVPSGA